MDEVVIYESKRLQSMEEAKRLLASATQLQEVQQIRAYASALELLARQARAGQEVQNNAAELKIRAERKAGELLGEMEKNKGASAGGVKESPRGRIVEPRDTTPTLSEIGISKSQSSRWQQIATIPQPAFERHLAERKAAGDELTTAGVLRVAKANQNTRAVTSSDSNEWYTPADYIEAARRVLGYFDLDPASSDAANETVQAECFYTKEDNGLEQEWFGNVWLNPPYGKDGPKFVSRLVEEYEAGIVTEAIILVNSNSTETNWFAPLWDYLLCFSNHRINFKSPVGNGNGSTHGSVFIYLGPNKAEFAKQFQAFGYIVRQISYVD